MILLQALWLLLPAGIANMAPIFAAKLFPAWSTPVDLGATWNGKELFGAHKTYRGLMSGTVMGLLVFAVQRALCQSAEFFQQLSLFNYEEVGLIFGAWMGLGALLGDLFKSFFKRQVGIAPGEPWVPFDQVDWIIGALLSISVAFPPGTTMILSSLFIGLVLHFLVRYVGYMLRLNSTPL